MSNYVKSSFLEDFEIPDITHENIKQKLLKVGNIQNTQRKQSFDSMPLLEKIAYVSKEVEKILGRYKGFVKVIYNILVLAFHYGKLITQRLYCVF